MVVCDEGCGGFGICSESEIKLSLKSGFKGAESLSFNESSSSENISKETVNTVNIHEGVYGLIYSLTL